MRRLLGLAALAAFALLYSFSAVAQQQVVQARSQSAKAGTLLTTGDTVVLEVLGSQWATVRWRVNTAGTATVTTETSNDGGTNWLASPYSKRLDAVSANPATTAWADTIPTAGTFETPLPGNVTQFRIRCGTSGTATALEVFPFRPHVPGVPVVATLYSALSGTNVALDTGILDMSGWTHAFHLFAMSGGTPAFAVQMVREDGVAASMVTSAAAFMGSVGSGDVIGGTAAQVPATSSNMLPARMEYTSAAIAAASSRILVQVRR